MLADATAKMLRAGVKGSTLVVEVDPLGDDIAQRITAAAKDFSADLVVMGMHGRRGWRRHVLVSVAERFSRILPAQCCWCRCIHRKKRNHAK